MPRMASAVRALLLAESGTGKTVLLNDLILCAFELRWPVFMLDAKGDPADAAQLVAQVRATGRTAAAGGPWNLFTGRADQVTEKLMRLMPTPDGANQHYLDEIRGAPPPATRSRPKKPRLSVLATPTGTQHTLTLVQFNDTNEADQEVDRFTEWLTGQRLLS